MRNFYPDPLPDDCVEVKAWHRKGDLMAADRFVFWQPNGPRPTPEQIQQALEDYVGAAGTVAWDDGTARFYTTLPGKPSGALRRAAPDLAFPWGEDARFYPQERWFEVCIGDDNLDVITRSSDEFANAVADGFAALCARVWRGKRDEAGAEGPFGARVKRS